MAVELSAAEQHVLDRIEPAEVVSLLQELVRHPSDYPPGDCRAAIRVVASMLDSAGVEYEIHSRREHQPNLVASLGNKEKGPRLLYHAHIDTVPVGERERWTVDPLGGELRDGRIYGRGAGDDKSSVAAQVMALLALARLGIPLNGSVQIAVVSDEESGGLYGTHWLHESGVLSADALVVGEQTENHIAIAERVACGIDLTVFGKSAHGAMPWAGENAVLKAARALTWLNERLLPSLAQRVHLYLPPPTLNVGKIQGGIQWSIVPERCKIEMDRRLLPGETRESAMEEIRLALEEFSVEVEPLRYELFSTGEVAANINTPPEHPFVALAQATLHSVSGATRPLSGYAQTSDGRWFARDGIPIIIFGPSDPAVAHAADEYVPVEQLVEAARFLTLLVFRWLAMDHSQGSK